MRGVEGEEPGLDLGKREAGDGAGELRGEEDGLLRVDEDDGCQPVGEAERGLEALGEALLEALAHDEAVDDDVDVVLQAAIEGRGLLDLVEGPIDADAGEAGLAPLGELLAIFPLAAADHGSQQEEPGAFAERHHPVGHLADGLRRDGKAGRRRMGDADPRPEQAHIVVDLGDGCNRRARVAVRCLLLDRDRRRQALDVVDIGLLHELEKLPGVGRERFDVAALALGVDGVEGEGGFPRAGQAREHDEPVARQIDVEALQIVLAGAADADVGEAHRFDLRAPGTDIGLGLPPGRRQQPGWRRLERSGHETGFRDARKASIRGPWPGMALAAVLAAGVRPAGSGAAHPPPAGPAMTGPAKA